MKRLRRGAGFAIPAVLAAGMASSSLGADAEGRFAIRGLGGADCARFMAAREAGGAEMSGWAGWVEGYLTGVNRLQADTYDVASWQTAELLLARMGKFCAENPEARFSEGLDLLIASIFEDRVKAESPLVRVEADGKAVFLYAETLAEVRRRLSDALGPQASEAGTLADALRRFQAQAGAPLTGLPDQPTLNALFR